MQRKGGRKGTDNVLADRGFDDAQELSAKAVLAIKLNDLIDKRGPSRKRAAEALWKPNHCMSTIADRARRRTVCT